MNKPIHKGNEALNIIFEPVTTDGEGFIHLWLGNTRKGKTYANNILVNEAIKRRYVDMVFTIDDKNPEKHQYTGAFRANVNHLRSEPIRNSNDAHHIVFRGQALRSNLADKVDHGEVAQMVWDLKRTTPKLRVLLNIDELADATNGHQDWKEDVNGEIYRKGAGVKVSTTATTQMPQTLPREAFGLSQSIGMFQLDAREVSYLENYRVITPDMVPILSGLERGVFILDKRGAGGWDGNIYKF